MYMYNKKKNACEYAAAMFLVLFCDFNASSHIFVPSDALIAVMAFLIDHFNAYQSMGWFFRITLAIALDSHSCRY